MLNPIPLINFNYWFLQTLAMMFTAFLLPGLKITGPLGALTTVVALAFVNANLWDAALFFHVPASFTMQAALLFITNGVIFWVLIKLLPGISVNGLLPAFVAPIVFTVCSVLIASYFKHVDWPAVIDAIIGVLEQLKSYFHETTPGLQRELTGTS